MKDAVIALIYLWVSAWVWFGLWPERFSAASFLLWLAVTIGVPVVWGRLRTR